MMTKSFWSPAMIRAIAMALLLQISVAAAAGPQPEFGGQCTEGLAAGRHVMTDCSLTWTDKDGKVYCFHDAASKTAFLKDPQQNLERARAFIAASMVQSTEEAMQNFDSNDAETVVKAHVAAQTKANGGIFALTDPLDGSALKLAFDGIDFTRTIDGYGFFPDVKFHDSKDAQKNYLVDFWVAPANGQLQIVETRIYQAPKQQDGKWTAPGHPERMHAVGKCAVDVEMTIAHHDRVARVDAEVAERTRNQCRLLAVRAARSSGVDAREMRAERQAGDDLAGIKIHLGSDHGKFDTAARQRIDRLGDARIHDIFTPADLGEALAIQRDRALDGFRVVAERERKRRAQRRPDPFAQFLARRKRRTEFGQRVFDRSNDADFRIDQRAVEVEQDELGFSAEQWNL